METIKISKKELRERGNHQTFRSSGVRINCFWFDWKTGEYTDEGKTKLFGGYKFMVAGFNLQKKDVFEAMYTWLVNGSIITTNPNIKIWSADTDQQRKKMPLVFNWNNW